MLVHLDFAAWPWPERRGPFSPSQLVLLSQRVIAAAVTAEGQRHQSAKVRSSTEKVTVAATVATAAVATTVTSTIAAAIAAAVVNRSLDDSKLAMLKLATAIVVAAAFAK